MTNVTQVTCIRAVPKHRRLLCGSRKFKVFQYQRPFIPDVSDDNAICCAKFSDKNFEIYVAGERSVKISVQKITISLFSSEFFAIVKDVYELKYVGRVKNVFNVLYSLF